MEFLLYETFVAISAILFTKVDNIKGHELRKLHTHRTNSPFKNFCNKRKQHEIDQKVSQLTAVTIF